MTIEARVARMEKALVAESGERRSYTLEQLVGLSMGATESHVGPPMQPVKSGELSLEELIFQAVPSTPRE